MTIKVATKYSRPFVISYNKTNNNIIHENGIYSVIANAINFSQLPKDEVTLQKLYNLLYENENNRIIKRKKYGDYEGNDNRDFLYFSNEGKLFIENRMKEYILTIKSITEYEKEKEKLIIPQLCEYKQTWAEYQETIKRNIKLEKINLILKEYDVYLKSEHWETIKKYMKTKYKVCQNCGKDYDLQVHHKTYENLGEEKEEDLLLVCKNCHSKIHGIKI